MAKYQITHCAAQSMPHILLTYRTSLEDLIKKDLIRLTLNIYVNIKLKNRVD